MTKNVYTLIAESLRAGLVDAKNAAINPQDAVVTHAHIVSQLVRRLNTVKGFDAEKFIAASK